MVATSSNVAASGSWWPPTASSLDWWRREVLSNRKPSPIRSRPWPEPLAAGACGFAGTAHLVNFGVQRRPKRLNPGLSQVAADQDEATAAILRRPALEPSRGMKDVLHSVDHCRPLGAFGNIDETLEAEEVTACVLGQHLEQERQADRTHRPLAHERKRGNVAGMLMPCLAAMGSWGGVEVTRKRPRHVLAAK